MKEFIKLQLKEKINGNRKERGCRELTIYHDYEGIARWCQGDWKANKEGTKAYKAYFDSIMLLLLLMEKNYPISVFVCFTVKASVYIGNRFFFRGGNNILE